MKNQSFHQRKIRIQEPQNLDVSELKARTVNALNKLGHQKFFAEPGGYALENWIKGVDVLLDEFEEKVGAGKLTPEYRARRKELRDFVARPVSVSSIEEEMATLNASISDIEAKTRAERSRTASRISELKTEQARVSGELERERERLTAAAEAQSTDSVFSRLLGRSRTQAKKTESRVDELEAKLATLSDESLEQHRRLKMIDVRSPESPLAAEWDKLEPMQARLGELEQERLDKVQLVKERVELTGSIADAIARIQ